MNKLKYIVIAVIISAVSWYAYSYHQSRQKIAIDSYQACIDAPGSSIMESYPAVCITKQEQEFIQQSWLTFTSSQYHFSIDYPSYAEVITQQYSNGDEYYIIFNGGNNQQSYFQILIKSEIIQPPNTLEEYITNKYEISDGYTHFGSAPSKVIELINIGTSNNEAHRIIYERKLNAPTNAYEVYFRLDSDRVILFDPGSEPQNQEEKELIDQILSSFRFIDQ